MRPDGARETLDYIGGTSARSGQRGSSAIIGARRTVRATAVATPTFDPIRHELLPTPRLLLAATSARRRKRAAPTTTRWPCRPTPRPGSGSSKGFAFDARGRPSAARSTVRRARWRSRRTSRDTRPAASRSSRTRIRCRAARSTTRWRRRSRRRSSRWATPRCASISAASASRKARFDDGDGEDCRCARGARFAQRALRRERRAAGRPRRLLVRRVRADAASRKRSPPSAWCSSDPPCERFAIATRARRHDRHPRRGGRRRPARRRARVGAAAGAAGRRVPRLRPLLPRPAAAVAAHDRRHVARRRGGPDA